MQASQPTPLNAPTASIAGQVVDPHCGQTKVVATTGGAHCSPQPEPGLVIHNGQASAPRVSVPMPSLVASAAARNPGLVPSHFVDMVWSAGSCWRKRGLRLQIGKRSRWPEGQNWVATAICIQQVEARCLES